MQKEIWRQIKEANGYFVSNKGRVKTVDRTVVSISSKGNKWDKPVKGKIFKPYAWSPSSSFTKYHYLYITQDGKRKNKLVHRLVAEAFIPNPQNKSQVNHIDGNGTNNLVSNLEWATQSENQRHKYQVLKRVVWHKRLPTGKQPRSKSIIQKTLDGKFVKEWDSCMQAVREIGANKSSLSLCANGKQKEHLGYTWWWKCNPKKKYNRNPQPKYLH